MDAWLLDLSDLAASRGLRYVLGPTHLCDVYNWLCFVFMSSATLPRGTDEALRHAKSVLCAIPSHCSSFSHCICFSGA